MPDNNNYNDLGNQIKDSVIDAINTGDFSGLSDSISQSVYNVLGDVGDQLNRVATQARNGGHLTEGQLNYKMEAARVQAEAMRAEQKARAEKYHQEQEERIRRNKEQRSAYVRRPGESTASVTKSATTRRKTVKFNDVGRVSGFLQIIVGGWIGFIFALGALGGLLDFEIVGAVVCLIFAAAFGYMAYRGFSKIGLSNRATRIKKLCGEKFYITIEDLMASTGLSEKKVIKDLKLMLSKGFFPEGFLDADNTTFMVSREVYDQYLETSSNYKERLNNDLKDAGIDDEKKVKLSPEQQAELALMMKDGKAGIDRLHELNDQIPGEAITEKLATLENLLGEIFDRVKEHPEQMKSCHKLMNYYLPTMLKLVEAYAEYDKVSVPGPDIVKAKDEIEKTLDTINQAFVQLLNNLFQDSVWDVTADAKVLKTMLKQEGLAEDDLINN